ncbi:MAG: cobalamin biosynthesis protein CbiX [Burkholderiaceae bacterium]|uniref:Cobalamin biosynthesis protein CbiX n=1 Tax=Cupriavidus metallidurans TaxID=119219 RepID=A0A482IRM6_9BURK|nr:MULTISPECIES: CbiX/SirB N-terminal domain-containing protein [Cupriavidus]KWR83282.1 cobalamin biosynthesis protein CbiX [Cupriavidus sp. SHE]PCH55602.1 MAG: cobalamin biosynthesis protein CbiX [Burkholderiaceae bacterium]QBP10911.1 cobalamin biosynthesis protein CbiX [Cupriavidus metallidurans]
MGAGRQGLILFGHGARDARWRDPFDRLHEKLVALLPDCAVRLAFLELMTPSLEDAIDELAATGVGAITVVPVFFGQGGHLRRDFPLLIDACRVKYPGVEIRASDAVGEVDSVLDAIAAYCALTLSPAPAPAPAPAPDPGQ